MKMNNKEAMDKIQAYFLTQPPDVVARLAASLMIDVNRIAHPEHLEEDEAVCLLDRINKNSMAVRKFLKEGPSGDLVIIKMNSDDITSHVNS